LIHKYHYQGYRLLIGSKLKYLAYLKDRPIACLGWGSAAWRPALASVIMGVIVVKIQFLPVWYIVIAGCVCYFAALLILRGLNRLDRDALYSVLDVTGLGGGSKH